MGWQIIAVGFEHDDKRGRVFRVRAETPEGSPPARVDITIDWPDGADAPPTSMVHTDMSKALDTASTVLSSLAGRIQNAW